MPRQKISAPESPHSQFEDEIHTSNSNSATRRRRPANSSASNSAAMPAKKRAKSVKQVLIDPVTDVIRAACEAIKRDDADFIRSALESRRFGVATLIDKDELLDIDDWTSFLHQATRHGALKCMELLFEKRIDPNITDELDSTALDEAALYGQVEAAKLLLAHNASLERHNNRNSTLLQTAASEGELEFIRWLLSVPEGRASINEKNRENRTALSFACSAARNSLACVELLLAAGATLNQSKDREGNTPLHWAVYYTNSETVRLLCRHQHISVAHPNKFGLTPFEYWDWDQRDQRVDEQGNRLDAEGKPINLKETKEAKMSILKKKVKSNDETEKEVNQSPVAAAREKRPSNSFRRNPHQSSRIEEKNEPVEKIVESRAGACKRFIFQECLLQAAMQGEFGDAAEVEKLLTSIKQLRKSSQYRIFPFDYDGAQLSPMQIAVSFEDDNTQILEILLKHGLPFDRPSVSGFLPIHEAANVGNCNAVTLLLNHGCSPNVPESNDGYGCLALASDHSNGVRVSEILLSHAADVNARDYHGNTALHWSVFRNNIPMVKYLINLPNFDSAVGNKWGNSALHYAFYRAFKSNHHLECLRVLLEAGLDATKPLNKQNQQPRHIIAGFNTERGKIAIKAGEAASDAGAKIIENYLSEQKEGKSEFARRTTAADLLAFRERERKKQDDILSAEPKLIIADIAGGNEFVPIPLINTIDQSRPDLRYIKDVIAYGSSIEIPVLRIVAGPPNERTAILNKSRCQCGDDCSSHQTCSCLQYFTPKLTEFANETATVKDEFNDSSERSKLLMQRGLDAGLYERKKSLRSPFRPSFVASNCQSLEMLAECTDLCGCSPRCSNRFTDFGITVRLQVYKTHDKGWAARAMEDIPVGTFVSEYVGELIDESEAQQRMKDYDIRGIHYLFGIRDSPFVLDPFKKGNVARFFNHSCEPNLTKIQIYRHIPGSGSAQSLRSSSSAAHLPRMGFFAARDICEGEELCISYDYEELEYPGGCLVCYCGADNCRHILV